MRKKESCFIEEVQLSGTTYKTKTCGPNGLLTSVSEFLYGGENMVSGVRVPGAVRVIKPEP